MKKVLVSLALILAVSASFGMGGKWWDEGIAPIVTNAPAVTNSAPAVTNVAPVVVAPPAIPAPSAGVIAQGSFARPCIAVGKDGKIYVASEFPAVTGIGLWVYDGKAWKGGQVVKTDKSNPKQSASRSYIPTIAVDADGWCWVAWRWGRKEWGTYHGPGVYIRAPGGAGLTRYINFTIGVAQLQMDARETAGPVLMSKDGAWRVIDRAGMYAKAGGYNSGGSGEKLSFAVSKNGKIWATAVNGCSRLPSAVSVSGNRQTWADYKTYPEQGDDLRYPGVCIASDNSVWTASVLGGKLRVNRVVAGKMAYPVNALPSIGDATMEERHGPTLVAQGDTVQAFWRAGSNIYRVDVEKALKGKAAPSRMVAGAYPACAVDAAGTIHMVYVAGGALCYRTL